METLVSKGKVKALGVSNFNQKEIQDILNQCQLVRFPLNDRDKWLIHTLVRHLLLIKWNYTVSTTNIFASR
jgi:diketogulonate reductase-like aldo/keto reductase